MRTILLTPCFCLLAACGQTGPLYLPDEGITTPVEITSAPVPAPAAKPETPREDDEPAPPPQ